MHRFLAELARRVDLETADNADDVIHNELDNTNSNSNNKSNANDVKLKDVNLGIQTPDDDDDDDDDDLNNNRIQVVTGIDSRAPLTEPISAAAEGESRLSTAVLERSDSFRQAIESGSHLIPILESLSPPSSSAFTLSSQSSIDLDSELNCDSNSLGHRVDSFDIDDFRGARRLSVLTEESGEDALSDAGVAVVVDVHNAFNHEELNTYDESMSKSNKEFKASNEKESDERGSSTIRDVSTKRQSSADSALNKEREYRLASSLSRHVSEESALAPRHFLARLAVASFLASSTSRPLVMRLKEEKLEMESPTALSSEYASPISSPTTTTNESMYTTPLLSPWTSPQSSVRLPTSRPSSPSITITNVVDSDKDDKDGHMANSSREMANSSTENSKWLSVPSASYRKQRSQSLKVKSKGLITANLARDNSNNVPGSSSPLEKSCSESPSVSRVEGLSRFRGVKWACVENNLDDNNNLSKTVLCEDAVGVSGDEESLYLKKALFLRRAKSIPAEKCERSSDVELQQQVSDAVFLRDRMDEEDITASSTALNVGLSFQRSVAFDLSGSKEEEHDQDHNLPPPEMTSNESPRKRRSILKSSSPILTATSSNTDVAAFPSLPDSFLDRLAIGHLENLEKNGDKASSNTASASRVEGSASQYWRRLYLYITGVPNRNTRDSFNLEAMTEEEIESKFTSLSLAFKTDGLTLGDRLDQQQRRRDTAEKNIEQELNQLKTELADGSRRPLSESEWRSWLLGLQSQLSVLEQTTSRVSSSAEQFGAVQQEARVARAIDLMLMHVDHLRRRQQRQRAELDEARRVLTEHNLGSESRKGSKNMTPSAPTSPPMTAAPTTATATGTAPIAATTTTAITTTTTATTSSARRSVSVVEEAKLMEKSGMKHSLPILGQKKEDESNSMNCSSSHHRTRYRRLSSPASRRSYQMPGDDNESNNVTKRGRKVGLSMHTTRVLPALLPSHHKKGSDTLAISGLSISTIDEQAESSDAATNEGRLEMNEEKTKSSNVRKVRSVSEDYTALRRRTRIRSSDGVLREDENIMDELDALAIKRDSSPSISSWTTTIVHFYRRLAWVRLSLCDELQWPWDSEETLLRLRYCFTTLLLIAAVLSLVVTFIGAPLY